MATTKQGVDQSEEDSAVPKNGTGREVAEDEIDAEIALAALAEIERDPSQVVAGEELERKLREMVG